jgi:penicillin-insensitive murein DD-endopeptidase
VRVALFALFSAVSYFSGAPAPVTRAPASIAPHAPEKVALEQSKKPAGSVWGRSVGSPTEGRLVGGSHLDETTYLRVVPSYAYGDVRWGTGPLVGAVDRAARQVRRQFPDAVLSAGQLSRQGGGEVERHASHESGRDADLGFYVRSQTGKPLLADHFVQFKGDGTATTWPGAFFDDARNWALVSSLVTDGVAHVSHIFVATPLRARLLSYAERIGAPMHVRVRASEVMAQPHGALPHDDHFHVRIGCPPNMPGCVEDPTAKKARFARVPVPHGRSHSGIGTAHHPNATPTPGLSPTPTPGLTPTPTPGPTPPPTPTPKPDEAPAMLIDDVDGIFDPDRH